MPFYKMVCIAAHLREYRHIKELVTQSAMLLMDNGAAVRSIKSLGLRTLPNRMQRHRQFHKIGDYWSMYFDAPPRLMLELNNKMRKDPRVIRWTILKLGEKLEDVWDAKERTFADRETLDTTESGLPPLPSSTGFELEEKEDERGFE